jgi:hypothetical protein
MKTIILILAVLGVTLTSPSILKSNDDNTEWLKIETQEDLRNYRFSNKPSGGKVYRNDSDVEVYGTRLLDHKKMVNKQIKLNKLKKNQQTPKFKSTYLDFTILQEDNIS